MNFLKHLYEIYQELDENLEGLKSKPTGAWRSMHFTEMSNSLQKLKNEIREFDVAINGVDEYDEKMLKALRKKVWGATNESD